ncbi:hypothetical protein BDD12DRAFT_510451 [Trichophaea hybrida]|nr:hypothetical protein BDD12DRAFT_510451 [Trichophaea hybrida]
MFRTFLFRFLFAFIFRRFLCRVCVFYIFRFIPPPQRFFVLHLYFVRFLFRVVFYFFSSFVFSTRCRLNFILMFTLGVSRLHFVMPVMVLFTFPRADKYILYSFLSMHLLYLG